MEACQQPETFNSWHIYRGSLEVAITFSLQDAEVFITKSADYVVWASGQDFPVIDQRERVHGEF